MSVGTKRICFQTPVDGRAPDRIEALLKAIGDELRAAETFDEQWFARETHLVIKPAEYDWSPYSKPGDMVVVAEMDPRE